MVYKLYESLYNLEEIKCPNHEYSHDKNMSNLMLKKVEFMLQNTKRVGGETNSDKNAGVMFKISN
jgi:hypothetical protein